MVMGTEGAHLIQRHHLITVAWISTANIQHSHMHAQCIAQVEQNVVRERWHDRIPLRRCIHRRRGNCPHRKEIYSCNFLSTPDSHYFNPICTALSVVLALRFLVRRRTFYSVVQGCRSPTRMRMAILDC